MRNKIIWLILALILPGVMYAGESVSTAEADSAYNAKEYSRAIQLYNSVCQEKGSNTALLYNLGNAYYQEGDYGNAMLCYLRAHRLDPRDNRINNNLAYLQSKVDDANKAELKGKNGKVTPDENSFFQNVRTAIAVNVSTDTWAVWGAILFIAGIGGVALYIFTRNVTARKTGFFGAIVCLGISVIFLCFSFMGANYFNSRTEGVITGFKVSLQPEPGKTGSEKNNVLTKGTVVQIISEETDAEGNVTWYKVRLNSDYIGWVDSESLVAV